MSSKNIDDAANKNNLYPLILFLIIIGFVAIVNCNAHNLSKWTALSFVAYIFGGMFIPGYTIRKIMGVDLKQSGRNIAVDMGLGYALTIIKYLVVQLLKIKVIAIYLDLVIFCLCIFYLIKRCGVKNIRDFKNKISLQYTFSIPESGYIAAVIVLCFLLYIQFYAVSLVYTLPYETEVGSAYHPDWLYWLGNTISAYKGFPLQDFRMPGVTFNYHYFSSLFVSYMGMSTKIDVLVLCSYFSYIVGSSMMILGFYSLISSFSEKWYIVAVGSLMFVFADGKYSMFQSSMYLRPFGFDYAVAMGMLAMTMLAGFYRRESFDYKEHIVTALFLACSVGSKGPIGMVVLFGFAVSSVYLLVRRKWKLAIGEGAIYLGTFLLVYFIFISGSYTSSGAMEFIGWTRAFSENTSIREVSEEIAAWGIGQPLFNHIITAVVYLIKLSYVSNILWIVGIATMVFLILKKDNRWINLVLFNSIVFFGNNLSILFNYPGGGSQIYFGMATMPYGIICGFLSIMYIRKYKKSIAAAIGIILALTLSILYYKWHRTEFRLMMNMGKSIYSQNGVFQWARSGNYCNTGQAEAYNWIRDNTDENAYFVMDNFGTLEEFNNQSELAGCMSERFIWNEPFTSFVPEIQQERFALVLSIHSLDDKSALLLRDNGISYYLQNKQYSTSNLDASDRVETVFDNEMLRIYEIK